MEIDSSSTSQPSEDPMLVAWHSETMEKVKYLIQEHLLDRIDAATLEKELKMIPNLPQDEIPKLYELMERIRAFDGLSPSSPAQEAAGDAHLPRNASRSHQTSQTEPNAMQVESPTPYEDLSEADRSKLALIHDIATQMTNPEATALIKGFTTGQVSFAEMVEQTTRLFIGAQHLVSRFICLTDITAQQRRFTRLAIVVADLALIIDQVPPEWRHGLFYEIAQLILSHTFPNRLSPTREFAIFVCKRAMPISVVLPPLNGPPRLLVPGVAPSAQAPAAAPKRAEQRESARQAQAAQAALAAAQARQAAQAGPRPSERLPPASPHPHVHSASSSSHCGPSYTQRPASYTPAKCSSRDSLGDSVLNDYFHCAGSGSEGSSQDSIRNPHEEALFRLEEDALAVDILIGRLQSTVRILAEIQNRLSIFITHRSVKMVDIWGETVNATNVQQIVEGSLLPQHIETFKTVIQLRTSVNIPDPVTLFIVDPAKFISEMTRLCMFQADEHVRMRRSFGKLWKQVFARQYIQMLDHRTYRVKNDDKQKAAPKAILSHLNCKHYEAMMAGREESLDFLESMDFGHYQLNILPNSTHTKSERHRLEKLQKQAADPNSVTREDLPKLPNHVSKEVLQQISSDIISLVSSGGDKLIGQQESSEVAEWLKETMGYLLAIPTRLGKRRRGREEEKEEGEAIRRANNSMDDDGEEQEMPVEDGVGYMDPCSESARVFCGPPHLYVVIRMYHILHERLRLAYYLSQTFDSSCWDFASVTGPTKPSSVAQAKGFPLHPRTISDPKQTDDNIMSSFSTHPPTPFFELSETYIESSNPEYMAVWEAEGTPHSRVTRAGAGGLITLGGAPPQPNTTIHVHLNRLAAHVRANGLTPSANAAGLNGAKPSAAAPTGSLSPTTATSPPQSDEDAASSAPLPDVNTRTPDAEKYARFLQLVKDVLGGRIDANSFEVACIRLLGVECYPVYTINRVITNLILQIKKMMTLPGRQSWWKLWASYSKARAHLTNQDSNDPTKLKNDHETLVKRYLHEAKKIAGPQKYVEFRMSSMAHLTVKMTTGNPTNRFWQPSLAGFEAYIKSWNASGSEGVDVLRRRVFLERSLRSQLPEDVRTEPIFGRHHHSWNLSQALNAISSRVVHSNSHLNIVLDPESYRLTCEVGSFDWMVKRGRKTTSTTAAATTSRKASDESSPLHSALTKLQHSPPTTCRVIRQYDLPQEINLIESITATQLKYPDQGDSNLSSSALLPAGDLVATRSHPRKSRLQRYTLDDEAADHPGMDVDEQVDQGADENGLVNMMPRGEEEEGLGDGDSSEGSETSEQ